MRARAPWRGRRGWARERRSQSWPRGGHSPRSEGLLTGLAAHSWLGRASIDASAISEIWGLRSSAWQRARNVRGTALESGLGDAQQKRAR